MQTKKHTIHILFIVLTISFGVLLVTVLGNLDEGKLRELCLIITGGVFTSSFVTILITIKEYQDEKKTVLEDYYIISLEFLNNYINLEYLCIFHPVELIKECLCEEQDNLLKREANTQLDLHISKFNKKRQKHVKSALKPIYEKPLHIAQDKMKECIWNQLNQESQNRITSVEAKEKYLAEEYVKIMSDYRMEIIKIMEQYIRIRKCKYNKVEEKFRKIDFLFYNKSIREDFIYNCIHNRQRKVLERIKEEAWHFEEYSKMENGNLPVMLSKILELQENLFEIKNTDGGYSIYNKYCFEIEKHLSRLHGIIYGKHKENFEPTLSEYWVKSGMWSGNSDRKGN